MEEDHKVFCRPIAQFGPRLQVMELETICKGQKLMAPVRILNFKRPELFRC